MAVYFLWKIFKVLVKDWKRKMKWNEARKSQVLCSFRTRQQQSSSLISRDDGCLFSLGKFQSPRLIAFLICLPESITPPLVNFPPLSTIFEHNLAQIFKITLAEFHSDILKITHSAEHTPGGNTSLILEIEIRCTADCAPTPNVPGRKGA